MTTVAEMFEGMSYGAEPEGDTRASEWLARHGGELGHFIDGGWTAPSALFDLTAPATGTRLARASRGAATDVEAAVIAARRAQPRWESLGGSGRARHLYALARAVQGHAHLLALLEAVSSGRTIRQTRGVDVPLLARRFHHYAGWAQLMEREFPAMVPVGVVGHITHSSSPLLTLANRVAPALAAGCTVVLEPAEEAPLPVLCFAELALEAGLPSGVLNVVTGGWETAELIVAQRGIDKISFTGSPEAGRRIREAAAGSGKELSLELRGSHSFVVFDDADLDSAVEGVVGALWLSHGHECRSSARLLVQEGVAERVEAKLRSRVERLRLGPPLDATVDVGSIAGQAEISDSALEWTTFRTPAEALALANAAEHVRAASVWAESLELALEIARGVECEVVCLNSASMLDVGAYHEGAFGKEGVREYLEAAWRKRAVERTSHELSGGGEPRRRDEGFTGAAPHPATSEIAPASGGNRKEIHAAVSAAVAARAWSKSGGYTRSRILRRVADGLASHAEEFARLIDATREDGRGAAEVAASISRLLSYAARADIHAGTARNQSDGVVLAMAESVGVIGIACPTEAPLLALISLVVPAIVMGNATVVVPSESHPKVAMEFQSLLAEAELPAGVVSIVAGARDALAAAIAEYDAVSALWYFGSREGALAVERAAAAGMKRTWAEWARRDWLDAEQGEGREFLRHATRVKTICLPCSE